MRKLQSILFCLTLALYSCVTSSEEKAFREKAKQDSIAAYNISVSEQVKKQSPEISTNEVDVNKRVSTTYSAHELRLPAGEIVGFIPEREPADIKREKIILVKIKQDKDNLVTIHNIDPETYEALHTGDILK